ncbi:ABC transporter permease subunit [Macrococcus brunensis]|uniref:ABC transporter permease subunit n=1 Tax=Macrococcus brunensis TaxID=198483 RepID=UPI001EEF7898|nr:ABC transporter permease subunit [Macrococcus brunensis]ULG72195.1 ABC transporter permease [Macrococcus brunensis]
MFNLIRNEWIKFFMRPMTWIMLALIVLVFIFGLVINHFTSGDAVENKSYGDDWKTEVQADIKDLSAKVAEISKKDPSKLSFDEAITKANSEQEIRRLGFYLEKGVQPPAKHNVYDDLLGTSPLINLVALMVIVIAGSLMSREHQQGTIKLLMIRPASRVKIFSAKYILVLLTSFIFVVFTYGVAGLFGLITSKMNPSSKLAVTNMDTGNYKMVEFWPHLAKVITNDFIMVVILATIAYVLSVLLRNTATAQGIALGLLFFGSLIVNFIASKTELVKYLWPANWSMNQYIAGTPPVKEMTYQFSFGYNMIALIIIVALTAYIFNKRDIAN